MPIQPLIAPRRPECSRAEQSSGTLGKVTASGLHVVKRARLTAATGGPSLAQVRYRADGSETSQRPAVATGRDLNIGSSGVDGTPSGIAPYRKYPYFVADASVFPRLGIGTEEKAQEQQKRAKSVCNMAGCEKTARASGYCHKHHYKHMAQKAREAGHAAYLAGEPENPPKGNRWAWLDGWDKARKGLQRDYCTGLQRIEDGVRAWMRRNAV